MTRPLSQVAREIRTDMSDIAQGAKTPKTLQQKFPYAWPYLEAMLQLNSVKEDFYHDSGRSVVLYFLSNATSWTGPNAKRLKAELKEMLKN